MDITATLAESPLFAALEPGVIAALAERASVFEIRGGATLFSQGDASDAVYIVVSGRLRAIRDERQVLGEIGRGEPIGEMGLLAEEPRTATVIAVRDSILFRFERQALVSLFSQHPGALLQTVRVIIHRLRATAQDHRRARIRAQRVVAIIPATPDLDVLPLAEAMARALSRHAPTLLVTPALVDATLGPGAAGTLFEDGARNERLMTWLAQQERDYRYLVYTTPPHAGPWARRCMRQSDRVLMVVDHTASPAPTAMVDDLRQSGTRASIDLLVLRPEGADGEGVLAWRQRIHAVSHFFVRPARDDDMASLARMITGRGIGLVLGGGGARGFAHLGLLRALDELDIPVDAVGGSSMGAFFAALKACGQDHDTMLRLARETFVERNYLNDYLFPSVALVRGRKFVGRLKTIFGDRQIETLQQPFFCVSSNLTRGQVEVHDSGPLAIWVATSMAVPGVAPPVVYKEDLLVDGALLNSLPVDVMRQPDRGPVIASDVSTAGELRAPGIEGPDPEGLFNWRAMAKRPGLFSIMFRTATVSSERRARERSTGADVFLRMPVGSVALFDWKRFDEVTERSYQYALEQLAPVRDPLLRGEL